MNIKCIVSVGFNELLMNVHIWKTSGLSGQVSVYVCFEWDDVNVTKVRSLQESCH